MPSNRTFQKIERQLTFPQHKSYATHSCPSNSTLSPLLQLQFHIIKRPQRNIPRAPQENLLLDLALRQISTQPYPIPPQHYSKESQKLDFSELPTKARSRALAEPDEGSLDGTGLPRGLDGTMWVVHPAAGVDSVGVGPVFGVVVGAGGVEVHAASGGEDVWGAVGFFARAPDDVLWLPAHFREVDDDGEGAEDLVL